MVEKQKKLRPRNTQPDKPVAIKNNKQSAPILSSVKPVKHSQHPNHMISSNSDTIATLSEQPEYSTRAIKSSERSDTNFQTKMNEGVPEEAKTKSSFEDFKFDSSEFSFSFEEADFASTENDKIGEDNQNTEGKS